MKRDFQKLLRELDEEELRAELAAVYDRFAAVREYYRMELGATTKPVLDRYKKMVRRAFFAGRRRVSKRGRSASKQVLKDFGAISIHPRDLVELYFYRAEVMTRAIGHYRIDNEPFHKSTVAAFRDACKLARREVLLEGLRPQVEALCTLFEEERRLGNYSFWPVFSEYFPS